MAFRVLTAALIAVLVGASGLSVRSSQAHATITRVEWDDPVHPTRLIATSGGDDIDDAPGSFDLKVFDSGNARVDLGDVAVSSDFRQLTVSVRPNLPVGSYRVDWMTTGDDGDEADGSINIQVVASAVEAAPGTSEPEHEDMHEHEAEEEEHGTAETTAGASPAHAVTFEVTISGANVVPQAVTSPASGLARFTFDPATGRLEYAVWVSGVSPNQVTGIHLHRGGADETGPHVFDILNGPATSVGGSTTLSSADIADLVAGRVYINLHTSQYTQGAARGQLILGAPGTGASGRITPPSTGDGGLLDNSGSYRAMCVTGAAIIALALSSALLTPRPRHG